MLITALNPSGFDFVSRLLGSVDELDRAICLGYWILRWIAFVGGLRMVPPRTWMPAVTRFDNLMISVGSLNTPLKASMLPYTSQSFFFSGAFGNTAYDGVKAGTVSTAG